MPLNLLIQTIYQWASNHTFIAPGFNNLYKKNFVNIYTVGDHICADYIQDIQPGRLTFDSADILNTVLKSVCCDWLRCERIIMLVSCITFQYYCTPFFGVEKIFFFTAYDVKRSRSIASHQGVLCNRGHNLLPSKSCPWLRDCIAKMLVTIWPYC